METESSVTRSAFKVYLGNAFTLIARLASQVVVAYLFGAGGDMDCFFAALVIPAYIEAVLISGVSLFMIPAFVHEEANGNGDDAWALTGTMFWFIAVGLTLLVSFAALMSHEIISVSAPGLGPVKTEIAAKMLAVMLFTVPLNGLAELAFGVLNARNSFFRPAIAPVFGTLANVTIVIATHSSVGPMALAFGYFASSLVRSFITVIPIVQHGWKRRLRFNDSRVVELLSLALPFILSGLLTKSTGIVERFFASQLPEGQLSYLGYAGRLSGNIMLSLGAGTAIAIFPAMARAYAKSGGPALAKKAQYGMRLTIAIALPALTIFSVIAFPFIKVIFERGSFEATATIGIGIILPIVLVGDALTHLLGNVLARTYFVMKDARTVAFVAFVVSLAYLALAHFMVRHWGYVGLAWAGTAKAALVAVILTSLLTLRLPSIRIPDLLRDALMYGFAALVASGAAWLVCRMSISLGALAQVAFSIAVGGTCYLAVLHRLDREIAVSLLELAGIPDALAKLQTLASRRKPTEFTDE